MHCGLVPACFVALGFCAAQSSYDISPELLQLAKIKVHMHETLSRQPNYTCVEEIERSSRRGPRHKFELRDMLRLEVALVDGHELFAWPGSSKFENDDLEKIVPRGGAIGNGNFALFARGVFESNAPMFEHKGLVELNGKKLVRYDYHVAQFQSGYKIKVNGGEAVVGYHGSFWADPETLDAIRLEVIADDIPPGLGLESASTSMDYVRIGIGQSDFLLPAGSDLSMTHITGEVDRNRVRFSACRQYTGESTLVFGEAPAAAAAPAPPVKTMVTVPAGLSFDVVLDAEIDSDRSMIGDPVKATLRQNIKHEKRILFEKGATLIGRIVRIEHHEDHSLIDIEFSEIDTEVQHGTMSASVDSVQSVYPGPGGSTRQTVAHSSDGTALTVKGLHIRLPRGFRLRLSTHATTLARN